MIGKVAHRTPIGFYIKCPVLPLESGMSGNFLHGHMENCQTANLKFETET